MKLSYSHKKFIIRFVSLFTSLFCTIVFIPFQAKAVEPLNIDDYAKAGAIITTLYGYYNNTNLAFDPAEEGPALTVIQNLYNDTVSNSNIGASPELLAAIGSAAIGAMAFAVVYDSVSGSPTLQLALDGNVVGSLDSFFNGMLSNMGLYRDPNSDLYQWLSANPIQSYSLENNTLNGKLVHNLPLMVDNGRNAGSYIKFYLYSQNQGDAYYIIRPVDNQPTRRSFCFVSDQSFTIEVDKFFVNGNASSNNPEYTSGIYSSSTGRAEAYVIIPFYNDYQENYEPDTYLSTSDYFGYGATIVKNTAAVFSSPYYYIGDPLHFDPVIDIPNPNDPNYIPDPTKIATDFPMLPDYGNPLPDNLPVPVPDKPYPLPTDDPDALRRLLDDLWKKIVEDDVIVGDPNPEPEPQPDPHPQPDPDPEDPEDPSNPEDGTIHAPLLPFLPNFNFNLSSIWHYVIDWVNSISSWFSLTFTIWSHLPYAIVVPVYATAVIVIVLGVYKRFFG